MLTIDTACHHDHAKADAIATARKAAWLESRELREIRADRDNLLEVVASWCSVRDHFRFTGNNPVVKSHSSEMADRLAKEIRGSWYPADYPELAIFSLGATPAAFAVASSTLGPRVVNLVSRYAASGFAVEIRPDDWTGRRGVVALVARPDLIKLH